MSFDDIITSGFSPDERSELDDIAVLPLADSGVPLREQVECHPDMLATDEERAVCERVARSLYERAMEERRSFSGPWQFRTPWDGLADNGRFPWLAEAARVLLGVPAQDEGDA